MKEKVMQGKPYAGNPHVRFDEGAGAPRHSGRPALLYMSNIVKMSAIMMVVALSMAAIAAVNDSSWRAGPSKEWFVNWDKALAEAKKTGKKLFVLNTGSDWCGWCKRLRANVLDQPEFSEFAAKNLVLVYLDSPSKNPLGVEQKAHNRQIARVLEFGRGVPEARIFTNDGKCLGEIGGGGLAVDAYIDRMKGLLAENGKPVDSEDGKIIFMDGGYKKWLKQMDIERTKAKKDDFKMRLTGIALCDAKDNVFNSLEFLPTTTRLEVAAGKKIVCRVELDFPRGYCGSLGVYGNARGKLCLFGGYLGVLTGKTVKYGSLVLRDGRPGVVLDSIDIGIRNCEPAFNGKYDWTIATVPVDIEFKGDSAAADTDNDSADAPTVSKSVAKGWTEDLEAAKKQAAKEGKLILIDFSGSDWCGWCKKMDEEVFAKDRFVREASKKFVLVMIDSPNNKSILSNLARRQNQGLKETYSVRGFPTVVIVDPDGKEVKRHSGYRAGGPNGYIKYLRELTRGVKWPKKSK